MSVKYLLTYCIWYINSFIRDMYYLLVSSYSITSLFLQSWNNKSPFSNIYLFSCITVVSSIFVKQFLSFNFVVKPFHKITANCSIKISNVNDLTTEFYCICQSKLMPSDINETTACRTLLAPITGSHTYLKFGDSLYRWLRPHKFSD